MAIAVGIATAIAVVVAIAVSCGGLTVCGGQVIKLKPPMVFSMGNARTLVAALDAVLTQLRCVDARGSDVTPRSKL